jgi:glyoxylase-like metal-dependent hydrolase (beta-lactamase superfamily II)
MTEIKRFPVGYLQTNCYVVTSDGYDGAVLVDIGGGFGKITDYLAEKGKKAVAALFTHGHFDHIFDAFKWQKCGVKLYISEQDAGLLENGNGNLASNYGLIIPPAKADFLVKDGDKLVFGDMNFSVMHTPGHTAGGVCYILDEKIIFSGDTLFFHSYGRTDFGGGDFDDISASVKKILALDGDRIVYPGHGESTTLKEERLFNPLV